MDATMDDVSLRRIKSAMIVYALEKSLGDYILQNPVTSDELVPGIKGGIVAREHSKGRPIDDSNVKMIVESSYLDEIFGFAIDIEKSTESYRYLHDLKNLCAVLNVFDIRNAISHPNRPFPECYWFRTATIASDPLIEKLNLYPVSQALHSAVTGNIEQPPEEWLNNIVWAIPNTLPSTIDHEITGLLGREKEIKELNKIIASPRNTLISIIAPGGVGKTALILEYLKDLSLSPESTRYLDAIVFTTLKRERLTTSGIEKLDAIEGISQIKDEILNNLISIFDNSAPNTFEAALDLWGSKKVLLCIDNLETLLMEEPQTFVEFNQSLPMLWRVIVTSRITVDSATTISLEPLKKKTSENLARNYLKKRGENYVTEETVGKIVANSGNNPLAIRLTVDLYLKGKDIPEAIDQSRKDIASFSFRNLIDALSETSVSVLESIFAQENSSRSELCELLELTNDEIAQSISDLSRTSLISRQSSEDEEYYSLNNSIRDLLMINPRNIEVRNHVFEKITQRKIQIQEHVVKQRQIGISEFHDFHIPPDVPDTIKLLAADENRLLGKKNKASYSELSSLQKRFIDVSSRFAQNYFYHYSLARLLVNLKDKNGWMRHFQESIKINPSFPQAKSIFAWNLFLVGDYDQSEIIYSELVENGWSDPTNSDNYFSSNIIKGLLQAKNALGKFDEIEKLTSNWETAHHKIILGSYRATSLKRSIEHCVNNDMERTVISLTEALRILEKLFSIEYNPLTCKEALRIIKELFYIMHGSLKYPESFMKLSLTFVAKHLFNIIEKVRSTSLDSPEVQSWLNGFYSIDIPDNPMKSVSWYRPDAKWRYDEDDINDLVRKSFKIVEVYYVPSNEQDASPYMFAKDEKGQQYYLKINVFSGGSWEKWAQFEVGTKLAIKYKPNWNSSTACPATEIVEIAKKLVQSNR